MNDPDTRVLKPPVCGSASVDGEFRTLRPFNLLPSSDETSDTHLKAGWEAGAKAVAEAKREEKTANFMVKDRSRRKYEQCMYRGSAIILFRH